MKYIVWNASKTLGIVTDDHQLAYELRKGSSNTLGILDYKFMDAWGDMTAYDNCTIEELK